MTWNQYLWPWLLFGAAAGLLIVGAVTLSRWGARLAARPNPRDIRSLLATLGPVSPDEATIVYLNVVGHLGRELVLDWSNLQQIVRDARLYVADNPRPDADPTP